MSSINFNIRMDESLKERAFPIIESYGLTPAQAVKLFFNQIANTRSISLSFNYDNRVPNEATRQAMLEAVAQRASGDMGKGYTDLNEMMRDIQKWQE